MTAISAEAHKSLIDAILNNNEEFVEDFIKTAAVLSDKENPNLETDQFLRDRRMDPLHAAVMKGHVGLIALLVETGFSDVNARAETTSVNDFSMTALHRAVLHQQPEAIESLLQLGADPNLQGTFRGAQGVRLEGTPADWTRQCPRLQPLKAILEKAESFNRVRENSNERKLADVERNPIEQDKEKRSRLLRLVLPYTLLAVLFLAMLIMFLLAIKSK